MAIGDAGTSCRRLSCHHPTQQHLLLSITTVTAATSTQLHAPTSSCILCSLTPTMPPGVRLNLLRRRRSDDPLRPAAPSAYIVPSSSPSSGSRLPLALSASAFASANRPPPSLPPRGAPPPYTPTSTPAGDLCPQCCGPTPPREKASSSGPELPFLAGVLLTFVVLYGMGWLSSNAECAGLRADIGVVYAQLESLQEALAPARPAPGAR